MPFTNHRTPKSISPVHGIGRCGLPGFSHCLAGIWTPSLLSPATKLCMAPNRLKTPLFIQASIHLRPRGLQVSFDTSKQVPTSLHGTSPQLNQDQIHLKPHTTAWGNAQSGSTTAFAASTPKPTSNHIRGRPHRRRALPHSGAA